MPRPQRILLTGANGYIGKRLLPVLLAEGYEVVCVVRDQLRFSPPHPGASVEVHEADFLNPEEIARLPLHIDVAFYLIHSMSSAIDAFTEAEARSATHFTEYIANTTARQVIYLGGIDNHSRLSIHLQSRKQVDAILRKGKVPVTTLKAGIIVGSGSASFEIIRDLVEKLPVMVAPRWLNTRCQPIAIHDVLQYLLKVTGNPRCYGHSYDIGGTEILTYKEMLSQYAEVRGLRRFFLVLPFMSPKLSSFWLYFITSTSYKLAVNLVNSMKVDVICGDEGIRRVIPIPTLSYREAIGRAFDRIEQNQVISSWRDALVISSRHRALQRMIRVPHYGTYTDHRTFPLSLEREAVIRNIWAIGGSTGWYYANALWKVRGFFDRLLGGTGLRRGRTHPTELHPGDALDFWRVLVADREQGRLLLYAEMKLPGEAWLEFRLVTFNGAEHLEQIATIRPKGLTGRLYWFAMIPAHALIFPGMGKRIAGIKPGRKTV
ncbi:MAG TPA: SDR family oxidoreductase [Bacteroidales bacterium]|nr:SDR family oxidoreductase [Bacteroidales bacterium]